MKSALGKHAATQTIPRSITFCETYAFVDKPNSAARLIRNQAICLRIVENDQILPEWRRHHMTLHQPACHGPGESSWKALDSLSWQQTSCKFKENNYKGDLYWIFIITFNKAVQKTYLQLSKILASCSAFSPKESTKVTPPFFRSQSYTENGKT